MELAAIKYAFVLRKTKDHPIQCSYKWVSMELAYIQVTSHYTKALLCESHPKPQTHGFV
jgi:hypothetical protein